MPVRIESKAEPLPGYTLIERIGGGGFGEVWKAEAPGGLHKAIKFVFGDLKGVGDESHRAEQELKALSRVKTVRHPYILSLERYDIIDGQLIIVMELAERNLWDRFKECRSQGLPGIPRKELLVYMEETAEALDLMNSQYQLQHLDIKPQNLFIIHQHVKVADFGLVKDLEGLQASVTGGVTPVYAAPETFDGWVSRFCDQYSLAIVYQELLTGQRPFNGSNVRHLIMQHLQAPPNVSYLPASDQPVIARALAKNPDDRFPTCREMVRLLLGLGAGQGPAPLPHDPSCGNRHLLQAANPGASPARSLGAVIPPTETERLKEQGNPQAPGASAENRSSSHSSQEALRTPPAAPDSSTGTTRLIRSVDPVFVRAAVGAEIKAPPEISGDGVLFPALLIGVGQMGLTVLQRLRAIVQMQLGSMDELPQLRTLLLDTDPEVMRSATRGKAGTALTANEVVLAPLNRPTHYLKPRDDQPELEKWLNARMLYRIPRSQVTTGVRALGRLAFCDNYRRIVRRLQNELEACLEPNALTSAARTTQLGVRSNRPRIYIVTSLAGGTGSGMFIDLAYTLRALLKQMGYEQPDIIGLFLLPPVDRNRTRTMTLGNAYAALSELSYYATPGNRFKAQYHTREAPIEDSEPPFGRSIMLPLPEESDEIATRELEEMAGQFLFRDLCSPLGRVSDLSRAGMSGPPWQSRGLFYQTFGLYRMSWPRRPLLQVAARRLCQQLLQRWISKDSKPIREAVQLWVQERWLQLGLGAEHFISGVCDACQVALARPPEAALQNIVDPLLQKLAAPDASNRSAQSRALSRLAADLVTAEELVEVLKQLDALVGNPVEEPPPEESPSLIRTMREGTTRLLGEWGQRLAELPVHLIEEPAFRLAGAEEAIRNLVATIEQVLQQQEPLQRQLVQQATDSHQQLVTLFHSLRAGRRPTLSVKELAELLRSYPRQRFQSQVLQHVTGAFISLRGQLNDELREVNFCRVRLTELLRQLEEGGRRGSVQGGVRPELCKLLFPSGCRDLGEAVERFLAQITPEILLELDTCIEEMLKAQFKALVNVCLNTANQLRNVETALLETTEAFANRLLVETSAAEMFLEQHTDPQVAADAIQEYYNEAAPELSPGRMSRVSEMCLLATPSDPSSTIFRQRAAEVLKDVELQAVPNSQDVVFYRELNHMALSDLEQLGPVGQDAYRQMTTTENFTPHTRIDVDFRSVLK